MIKDYRGLASGLIFLLLGVISVAVLIPFGIDEPAKIRHAVLSPSFYPRLVSAGLASIGGILTIRAIMVATEDGRFAAISTRAALKATVAICILFTTAWALPHLGFVLATTLALSVLMLLAGERHPATILLVAVLTPITIYLFFVKLANVPIPGGVFEPYLRSI